MVIGIKTSILACGVIVILYTVLGGLLALVVTDYLQFFMKAPAILVLLPLAVWRLAGHSPRRATTAFPDPRRSLWLVYFLGYLLIVGISDNGSWSFAQKPASWASACGLHRRIADHSFWRTAFQWCGP